MPENLGADGGRSFYASVAAENMTREQLNYYSAIAKGMDKYDNSKNEAVEVSTLPEGVTEAPTKMHAFHKIELAAEGGHAASMMRMGDLTRKDRDGLQPADPEAAAKWLKDSHTALETTMHDPAKNAAEKGDANWDMSAVHYYNSTLDKKADLPLPDGIKTPEEADLYYTTLAARTDTNHRYGEWVERVNEGTEYPMDEARKQEIMGMANGTEFRSPRISKGEGVNDAPPYPAYVSTAESKVEMLEAWRDGKTNPADSLLTAQQAKEEAEKGEEVDPKRVFGPEQQQKIDNYYDSVEKDVQDRIVDNNISKLGLNEGDTISKSFAEMIADRASEGFNAEEIEEIKAMAAEKDTDGNSIHVNAPTTSDLGTPSPGIAR